MIATYLHRIEFELLGDLVNLDLESETGLWRSMSSLWTTWRFVCEDSDALKLITRHLVGNSL